MEFTCCKHPLLTSHIEAGSFPGWVFVTRLEMPPHFKCSLVHRSCIQRSTVKCTSAIQPATGTHYPQVSQVSGTDLPVQRQGSPPSVRTTIDRQHLARHAGSPGGSPSGYLISGFSASAINPHPSTSQTWVSESTDVRLLQVVVGIHISHIPTWHASPQISTP